MIHFVKLNLTFLSIDYGLPFFNLFFRQGKFKKKSEMWLMFELSILPTPCMVRENILRNSNSHSLQARVFIRFRFPLVASHIHKQTITSKQTFFRNKYRPNSPSPLVLI